MTVKMIATDMDGTLLDGQGQLDLPRLTTILDELDKRNIRFVVATGNEIPRMRLLLGDLVERMTLVVANGARIFEKNQLSMSSFWEAGLIRDALAYFSGRERELQLVVTSERGGFVQEGTEFPLIEKVMTKEMAQLFYKRMNFVPSLQDYPFDKVLKMSMMVEEAAAVEHARLINQTSMLYCCSFFHHHTHFQDLVKGIILKARHKIHPLIKKLGHFLSHDFFNQGKLCSLLNKAASFRGHNQLKLPFTTGKISQRIPYQSGFPEAAHA